MSADLDSLLGDKSLHVFGSGSLNESIQATQDVLMAGGKMPITPEAAARNVVLQPQCTTPWDLYDGRWVRIAPLENMFDVNPATGRPPWTPRATSGCLSSPAAYYYNNRRFGLPVGCVCM